MIKLISDINIKCVDNDCYRIHDNTIREHNLAIDTPFAVVDSGKHTITGYFVLKEYVINGWSLVCPVDCNTVKKFIHTLTEPESMYITIKRHFAKWARETDAKNFVVGISGGKDSTVVAMLLCAIFGKERVHGVLMPQGEQRDIKDSFDIVNMLGISYSVINIKESVRAITDQLWDRRTCDDVYPTKDMEVNLPARIRMATLHAVGQCINGRVINTSNLSEDMVGYATQFGDNAGAYAPIQGLTVTEVKSLGAYLIRLLHTGKQLNAYVQRKEKNPETGIWIETMGDPVRRLAELVDKVPVDGLQAQTDEERLGFTYDQLDRFIRKNEGTEEFKEMIRKKYKQNKFKLDIVQMPQPDFSFLPNFVKIDNCAKTLLAANIVS